MAPSTKGNGRMDAAIDAMTNTYGFTDLKAIRAAANQLLEVYENQWFFIEDNSYAVLLDALLDQQKDEELLPMKDNEDESSSRRDQLMEIAIESHEDSVRRKLRFNREESAAVELADDDDRGKFVEEKAASDGASTDDEEEPICVIADFPSMHRKNSKKDVMTLSGEDIGMDSVSEHPPPSPRKRRPCYGWIDSDEEDGDDEEFIDLSPARSWEDLEPKDDEDAAERSVRRTLRLP